MEARVSAAVISSKLILYELQLLLTNSTAVVSKINAFKLPVVKTFLVLSL